MKTWHFSNDKIEEIDSNLLNSEYSNTYWVNRNSIMQNEIDVHPLVSSTHDFKILSPWVLVDKTCAMRFFKDDDPLRYGSRVAFVEKSARVLIDNDNNWLVVNKSSDYGLSLESLLECDKKLLELGYY